MRQSLSLLLPFFFALLFTTSVDAIEFTVSNPQISGQEIAIDVSLSGVTSSNCPSAKCYLQGILRAADSTYYFGETLNNKGVWIDYISSPEKEYITENFFAVEIVGSSWSGQLKVRYKSDDSRYKGPGTYDLKVRRYTGGSSSSAGEAATTVSLTAAIPQSPTATPTPQSTSSPTPTSTPKPTATSTPTPTPTKQATPTPSKIPEETPMVLGETIEDEASPSSFTQNDSWKPIVISMLLVATGLAILAGLYTWKIAREKYSDILNR